MLIYSSIAFSAARVLLEQFTLTIFSEPLPKMSAERAVVEPSWVVTCRYFKAVRGREQLSRKRSALTTAIEKDIKRPVGDVHPILHSAIYRIFRTCSGIRYSPFLVGMFDGPG